MGSPRLVVTDREITMNTTPLEPALAKPRLLRWEIGIALLIKILLLTNFTSQLLGTRLSALWILIANGWMQYPVSAEINYETLRMEMTSFADIFFNPVAQVKFVHTVAAGYVAHYFSPATGFGSPCLSVPICFKAVLPNSARWK